MGGCPTILCREGSSGNDKCLKVFGWGTLFLIISGLVAGFVDVFVLDVAKDAGITWLGGVTVGLGGLALVGGFVTAVINHSGKGYCTAIRFLALFGTIALMILPSLLGHHYDVSTAKDIFTNHSLDLLYPGGAIVSSIVFFGDIEKKQEKSRDYNPLKEPLLQVPGGDITNSEVPYQRFDSAGSYQPPTVPAPTPKNKDANGVAASDEESEAGVCTLCNGKGSYYGIKCSRCNHADDEESERRRLASPMRRLMEEINAAA